MKKILLVFFSIFAFVAISNEVNAQNVYFTNDKYVSAGTMTAQIYCSQVVTIKFEVQVSGGSSYTSSRFVVAGNSLYGAASAGQTNSTFYTVSMPAGYSDVTAYTSNGTGVLLISEINGKPTSTRPLVVRP